MGRPEAQAALPLRWTQQHLTLPGSPGMACLLTSAARTRGAKPTGALTKTSFQTVCPCLIPFREQLSPMSRGLPPSSRRADVRAGGSGATAQGRGHACGLRLWPSWPSAVA